MAQQKCHRPQMTLMLPIFADLDATQWLYRVHAVTEAESKCVLWCGILTILAWCVCWCLLNCLFSILLFFLFWWSTSGDWWDMVGSEAKGFHLQGCAGSWKASAGPWIFRWFEEFDDFYDHQRVSWSHHVRHPCFWNPFHVENAWCHITTTIYHIMASTQYLK